MTRLDQETVARALVSDGKGILAADETIGTLTKRFEALKIPSTPESRRDYRELLFTTPGTANFISGVIMYDETIRQNASNGMPLPDVLVRVLARTPPRFVPLYAKAAGGWVWSSMTPQTFGTDHA